ncbi:hypothetical protein B6K86_09165 [Lachnospiraceae bacterium]|nr:hypothetical protein B6K86_09165 [Lachnospiraceae bacterium]
MDFLLKALTNFIANILRGLLECVLSGIVTMFQELTKTYVTHGLIVSAHNTVLGISIALIVLFCVKQYFNVYVMETAGDPSADPMDIMVRGAEATAVTSCSSWGFYTFINFSSAFAADILDGTKDVDYVATFDSVLDLLTVNPTRTSFIWMLFLLTTLIGIFAFSIIATIRALELSLMFIVLPFFCVELTQTSHERFNGLVTNIIVTGLYFSLQLLLFSLFLNQLISVLTGVNAESSMEPSAFVAIGFMIAMLKTPKWLDKFVYNSGTGDMAKRGVGTVGTSAARSAVARAFRKG